MSILQEVHLTNFSAFHQLDWTDLGQLNVVIGVNDTGKTQLLKLLYVFSRNFEEYIRKGIHKLNVNASNVNASEDLAFTVYSHDKLHWTFLQKPIVMNSLITHGQESATAKVSFINSSDTIRLSIQKAGAMFVFPENIDTYQIESCFIPTKEIFSVFDAIVETREGSKQLNSFDDTYYDLVRDFRLPVATNIPDEIKLIEPFDKITGGGKIEYTDQELWFVRDAQRYGMHQVAEGIRKISIFDRLIRNHRLKLNKDNPTSVLFLDEPETSLHPEAIIIFAEVLHDLAQNGVQVFLTTHSYFLLKRLEQLAKKNKTDYTLLNLQREDNRILSSQTLLRNGMPENPIIDQSMRLYYEDVGLTYGSESK